MDLPSIEEFIERSKVNCAASADLTVKRRFIYGLGSGTPEDKHELEKLVRGYMESEEGIEARRKALNAGKFYRLLISENASEEPRVVKAYTNYISSLTPVHAPSGEHERHAPKKKKKQKSSQARKAEYYAQYRNYIITKEDTDRLAEAASQLITEHYSDVRKIISPKYMREMCSEFVSEQTYGKFMRRMYDEASLNKKRIDAVIYSSYLPYETLNQLLRGMIAERVLADSGYGAVNKRRLTREFLASYCPVYPQIANVYMLLINRFDREKLTSVITEGAEYKRLIAHMKNQIEISEQAHEMILREIPDNVIDLYPGARAMHRHFILHLGPTNSGKTYQSLQACMKAETGVYLAPLRLLAYEICEKFNIEGVPCNMRTGEEEIEVPFASHTASTVEMLNVNEHYDVAVVDECQLIEDEERGGAWTAAILGLMADEIHLCASENAEDILIMLITLCSDSYEIVRHYRSVPLVFDERRFIFPQSVEPEDALIAFSKKSVLMFADELRAVGVKASVIYGDLPYDVRRSEVARFVNGETDVVVATDAVGMGLNLPIKRVVFLETHKYDGHRRRFLHGTEIKQIAGRAGRMGMFDTGYFTSAEFPDDINRKLHKKSHSVKTARLRIPETIISVDMPLSEILLRWGTIPDDDIFTKNSVEREVMLARDLEKISRDKLLIYRFVTIPFSETRKELYEFWYELFENEVNNTRKSVYFYIRTLERRGSDLEDHELAYRKCDILYFYFDRFGLKEDLNAIMELKHDISADIMAILSGS